MHLNYSLKVQFAGHGIPEVLVTNSGTQFSSSEFAKFTETWRFEHKNSGLPSVERKSRECHQSLQSAAEETTSRQQRSSASVFRLEKHPVRRSRNLTGSTSDGQKNTNAVANSHQTARTKSRQPDRRQVGKVKSHPRAAVQPGRAIRMKLPGDTKWSLGSCVKILPNRSYEVNVVL